MQVKIDGKCFSWHSERSHFDCCGVTEHYSLSRYWSDWEDCLHGEFPDFVSAFLYSLIDIEGVNVVTDKKGGFWDRYLFEALAERMELELDDGTMLYFKCTFSGWIRNPNTYNLIQLVTIIKE